MANEVQDILRRHLEHLKATIIARIAENNRNVTGRTAASLTISVSGNSGSLTGSGSFLAIERGRGGGKVPYNFVGIIREWIVNKGISYKPIPAKRKNVKYTPMERGLNSFAGAVAYKIMKEGSRMHRDNLYNDIYTSAVNEELEALAGELVITSAQSIAKINREL